jgi:hypothetical protein
MGIDEAYRNPEGWEKQSWIDVTNCMHLMNIIEHFIIWTQNSGVDGYRKLWGVINHNLPVGNYSLHIENSILYNFRYIKIQKRLQGVLEITYHAVALLVGYGRDEQITRGFVHIRLHRGRPLHRTIHIHRIPNK